MEDKRKHKSSFLSNLGVGIGVSIGKWILIGVLIIIGLVILYFTKK